MGFIKSLYFKFVAVSVAIAVFFTGILGDYRFNIAYAQIAVLPVPGTLLPASKEFSSPAVRGITFDPAHPAKIKFLIEEDSNRQVDQEAIENSAGYFLAGLSVPAQDLWVNLSPYEEERVIPEALSLTALGQGLLEEDYILKQLAASSTYPETEIGKKYWQSVNGTGANGRSPVNNFNRVWIVPGEIVVRQEGNRAFIEKASLKVMCEEDYLAMQNNSGVGAALASAPNKRAQASSAPTESFKKIILPTIEQEVNAGKNFASLRQIYYALILATWFKKRFKPLFSGYTDKNKVAGIDWAEKESKEKIYRLYIKAFKQGAYNYVKKEAAGANGRSPVHKITKRQYFSGGVALDSLESAMHLQDGLPANPAAACVRGAKEAQIQLKPALPGQSHQKPKRAGALQRWGLRLGLAAGAVGLGHALPAAAKEGTRSKQTIKYKVVHRVAEPPLENLLDESKIETMVRVPITPETRKAIEEARAESAQIAINAPQSNEDNAGHYPTPADLKRMWQEVDNTVSQRAGILINAFNTFKFGKDYQALNELFGDCWQWPQPAFDLAMIALGNSDYAISNKVLLQLAMEKDIAPGRRQAIMTKLGERRGDFEKFLEEQKVPPNYVAAFLVIERRLPFVIDSKFSQYTGDQVMALILPLAPKAMYTCLKAAAHLEGQAARKFIESALEHKDAFIRHTALEALYTQGAGAAEMARYCRKISANADAGISRTKAVQAMAHYLDSVDAQEVAVAKSFIGAQFSHPEFQDNVSHEVLSKLTHKAWTRAEVEALLNNLSFSPVHYAERKLLVHALDILALRHEVPERFKPLIKKILTRVYGHMCGYEIELERTSAITTLNSPDWPIDEALGYLSQPDLTKEFVPGQAVRISQAIVTTALAIAARDHSAAVTNRVAQIILNQVEQYSIVVINAFAPQRLTGVSDELIVQLASTAIHRQNTQQGQGLIQMAANLIANATIFNEPAYNKRFEALYQAILKEAGLNGKVQETEAFFTAQFADTMKARAQAKREEAMRQKGREFLTKLQNTNRVWASFAGGIDGLEYKTEGEQAAAMGVLAPHCNDHKVRTPFVGQCIKSPGIKEALAAKVNFHGWNSDELVTYFGQFSQWKSPQARQIALEVLGRRSSNKDILDLVAKQILSITPDDWAVWLQHAGSKGRALAMLDLSIRYRQKQDFSGPARSALRDLVKDMASTSEAAQSYTVPAIYILAKTACAEDLPVILDLGYNRLYDSTVRAAVKDWQGKISKEERNKFIRQKIEESKATAVKFGKGGIFSLALIVSGALLLHGVMRLFNRGEKAVSMKQISRNFWQLKWGEKFAQNREANRGLLTVGVLGGLGLMALVTLFGPAVLGYSIFGAAMFIASLFGLMPGAWAKKWFTRIMKVMVLPLQLIALPFLTVYWAYTYGKVVRDIEAKKILTDRQKEILFLLSDPDEIRSYKYSHPVENYLYVRAYSFPSWAGISLTTQRSFFGSNLSKYFTKKFNLTHLEFTCDMLEIIQSTGNHSAQPILELLEALEGLIPDFWTNSRCFGTREQFLANMKNALIAGKGDLNSAVLAFVLLSHGMVEAKDAHAVVAQTLKDFSPYVAAVSHLDPKDFICDIALLTAAVGRWPCASQLSRNIIVNLCSRYRNSNTVNPGLAGMINAAGEKNWPANTIDVLTLTEIEAFFSPGHEQVYKILAAMIRAGKLKPEDFKKERLAFLLASINSSQAREYLGAIALMAENGVISAEVLDLDFLRDLVNGKSGFSTENAFSLVLYLVEKDLLRVGTSGLNDTLDFLRGQSLPDIGSSEAHTNIGRPLVWQALIALAKRRQFKNGDVSQFWQILKNVYQTSVYPSNSLAYANAFASFVVNCCAYRIVGSGNFIAAIEMDAGHSDTAVDFTDLDFLNALGREMPVNSLTWIWLDALASHKRQLTLLEKNALLEGIRIVKNTIGQDQCAKFLEFLDSCAPYLAPGGGVNILPLIEMFFAGQGVAAGDYLAALLPEEARAQLAQACAGRSLDEFMRETNSDNYTLSPRLAALYLQLRRTAPVSTGLSFEKFCAIAAGREIDEAYAPAIAQLILSVVLGETKLSVDKQRSIIRLSVALHRAMSKLSGSDERQKITFRELVRFNVDFTKYCLRQEGMKNVVEYFILTAATVYSRVLADDAARQKFKDIFCSDLLNRREFTGLLGAAQVDSEKMRGNLNQLIDQLVDYADFDNLGVSAPQEAPAIEAKVDAVITRGVQVNRPQILIVDDDNTVIVNRALERLYDNSKNTVERLSFSGFSQRKELLGMYKAINPPEKSRAQAVIARYRTDNPTTIRKAISDILSLSPGEEEDYYQAWLTNQDGLADNEAVITALGVYLQAIDTGGNPQAWKEYLRWEDGIVTAMAKEAAKPENAERGFFIVGDNIEACPGQTRVEFNPILWERLITLAQRGERIAIPKNMHFIFTMHKTGRIKDEAFLNRSLIAYIPALTPEDCRRYLTGLGLTLEQANYLLSAGDEFKALCKNFSQDIWFSFNDLIEIALRAKALGGGDLILRREAYNYLQLKLPGEEEKQKLLKELFNNEDFAPPAITIERDPLGRVVINFDGVIIPAAESLAAYVGQPFALAARQCADGYIADDLENRILCQCARALTAGGSDFIQIFGPSGEGKTEVAKAFARLIDFELVERHYNEDSDNSTISGQTQPARSGRYIYQEAYYQRRLETPRAVFSHNETNASEHAGFALFPEVSQQRYRFLPDVPQENGHIARRTIARGNLHISSANPALGYGRFVTPRRVLAHGPVFWMQTDINRLGDIVNSEFDKRNLSACAKQAGQLTRIHREIFLAKKKGQLVSPQELTKRRLISAIARFEGYLAQASKKGAVQQEELEQLFQRAVESEYFYLWKNPADIAAVKTIVKNVLGKEAVVTPQQALITAVKERRAFIHLTGATDAPGELESAIKSVYGERADIVYEPLSFFQRERQLLSGFIPAQTRASLPGKWQALSGLAGQFDTGLGVLLYYVEQARLAPQRELFLLMPGYLRLSSQVAPGLNEFLQTGRSTEIAARVNSQIAAALKDKLQSAAADWQRLQAEYNAAHPKDPIGAVLAELTENEQICFARWFYSQAPPNLHLAGQGSCREETSLSPAELDRVPAVNTYSELDEPWLRNHCQTRQNEIGLTTAQAELAADYVVEAFNLYNEEYKNGEYKHNRFSRYDVDEFFAELKYQKDSKAVIDDALIKKIAYYTIGIGLRPSYQRRLNFDCLKPQSGLRYFKKDGKVYFEADGISAVTNFSEVPGEIDLADLTTTVKQMASLLIAQRHSRPVISEGFPGGGKTETCQALGRLLGREADKAQMFSDIDPGEQIGVLSKKGSSYVITALEKDPRGKWLLPFLRMYDADGIGGVYALDEGPVGFNAQEEISFMVELAKLPYIDLGMFHPGLQGIIIRRHPGFTLVTTQNPARLPKTLGLVRNEQNQVQFTGRDHVLYGADSYCHKIWGDNVLEVSDAVLLLNKRLKKNSAAISETLKKQIGGIHYLFTTTPGLYPMPEELSPRQIITIAEAIEREAALLQQENVEDISVREKRLFAAIMRGVNCAYLSGLPAARAALCWQAVYDAFGEDAVKAVTNSWYDSFVPERDPAAKVIRCNGAVIPISPVEGNITRDNVAFSQDIPSQNKALNDTIFAFSLGKPAAILEEEDTDSLEFMRKVAWKTGYKLERLDSHAEMSKMHLVGTVLPEFSSLFDAYGVKATDLSEAFSLALGFLSRHMVTEEEMGRLDPAQQEERILYFHLMDTIPERQRVILNEVFNSRRLSSVNEKGETQVRIIPPWVHIALSAPRRHKFASAFINRCVQVDLPFFTDNELVRIIRQKYPFVRTEELEWLVSISQAVRDYEKSGALTLHYNPSRRDIFDLAMLVQREKQRDYENQQFNNNPVYYAVKAVLMKYAAAMEEHDRERFEREIVGEYLRRIFNADGVTVDAPQAQEILARIKAAVDAELTAKAYEPYQTSVSLASLAQGAVQLPNGIRVAQNQNGIEIIAGKTYHLSTSELNGWYVLQGGVAEGQAQTGYLRVKISEGNLLIETDLLKNLGQMEIERPLLQSAQSALFTLIEGTQRVIVPNLIWLEKTAGGLRLTCLGESYDFSASAALPNGIKVDVNEEENRVTIDFTNVKPGKLQKALEEFSTARLLPEHETSTATYINFTPEITRQTALMLRQLQPVRDSDGQLHRPRAIMINGRTAAAKTSLMRNLALTTSYFSSLYLVNADEDLKVSDVTAGLSMEEGKIKLGVKELLARCGKVTVTARDGSKQVMRVSVPGKTTGSYTGIVLDEANASPRVVRALLPVLRGEKKFTIEYAGESLEVELDDNVALILTFNPAELYGDRGISAQEDENSAPGAGTLENFSRDATIHCQQLWAFDPENYPDLTLEDILVELYRRGITKADLRNGQTIAGEAAEPEVYYQYATRQFVCKTAQEIEAMGGWPPLKPLAQVLTDMAIVPAQAVTISQSAPMDQESQESVSPGDTRDEIDVAPQKPRERSVPEAGEIKVQAHQSDTDILEGREVIDFNRDVNDIPAGEKKEIEFYYNINPSLYREAVYNRLEGLSADSDLGKESMAALGSGGAQSIEGSFVKVISGDWQAVPSPGPADMLAIADYKAVGERGQPVELEFACGENTGTLYARAKNYQGRASITLQVRLNSAVYHANGRTKAFDDHARLTLAPPAKISDEAQKALQYIQVPGHSYDANNYAADPKQFIEGLVLYFRSIVDQADGVNRLAKDQSSNFMKIISSHQGVCRQRAYAFFALTKMLGFDVRYIENQLHAFCEIRTSEGWVRVDLGGGGDPANYGHGDQPENMQDVDNPQALPEPNDAASLEHKKRFAERSQAAAERDKAVRQYKGTPQAGNTAGQQKPSPSGKPGQGGSPGAGGGRSLGSLGKIATPQDSAISNIVELLEINPDLVGAWLELFAGIPRVSKLFSESGTALELERVIAQLEPFYRIKINKALGKLRAGLTFDVSGSVSGMEETFMDTARFFASLFHYAAMRNKGVEFSFGLLGSTHRELLAPERCTDPDAVKEALGKMRERLGKEGTDIAASIEAIIERHKNKPADVPVLEFVETDGMDSNIDQINRLLAKARSQKIDIVLFGVNSPWLARYQTYLNLDHKPTSQELMLILMSFSILKAEREALPLGDLSGYIKPNVADTGYWDGHDKVNAFIAGKLADIAVAQGQSREAVESALRLGKEIELKVDGQNIIKTPHGETIVVIDSDNLGYLDQQAHSGISRNRIYITRQAYEVSIAGKSNRLNHELTELRGWRAWADENAIPYSQALIRGGVAVAQEMHRIASLSYPVDVAQSTVAGTPETTPTGGASFSSLEDKIQVPVSKEAAPDIFCHDDLLGIDFEVIS